MKVLHFSQALILNKPKWGGAEHTDERIVRVGVEFGHKIKTINCVGMVIDWKTGEQETLNDFENMPWRVNRIEFKEKNKTTLAFDRIKELIDWADAIMLCNIMWFNYDKLAPLFQYAVDSGTKIIFHPHHFLPCVKIGLPGTTEELCENFCKGKYRCKDGPQWVFFKWIMDNASVIVTLSPLHTDMFHRAFGKDNMEKFIAVPPAVDTEKFYDMELDRIFDCVTVGGGSLQKGVENHIEWAKKNPDRQLDIYGNLADEVTLPKNVSYKGKISNDALPTVLNLYKDFIAFHKCEDAYCRTVAEAQLCGCNLIVDESHLGAMSYETQPIEHQDGKDNGFWAEVEKRIDKGKVKKNSLHGEFNSSEHYRQRVSSILVTTTTGLGNIVMMLPMFDMLLEAFPNTKIVHIEPTHASVVTEYAYRNEPRVITVKNEEETPEELMPFDIAIRPVTACDKRYDWLCLEHAIYIVKAGNYDWEIHDVERYASTLKRLGWGGEIPKPNVRHTIYPKERRFGIGILIGYSKADGGWHKKHWGNDKYIELIKLIRKNLDEEIWLISGVDETDRQNEQEIIGGCVKLGVEPPLSANENIDGIINMAYDMDDLHISRGARTLEHYMSVMFGRRVIVGNDTGMSHVADALEVPTISIFGPTIPSKCHPYRYKDLIVTPPVDCKHCHKKRFIASDTPEFVGECDLICMKSISPEQVFEGIKRLV